MAPIVVAYAAGLLPIGDHGWARAMSIEPVMRRRLVERIGAADPDAMDGVNAALRAVQDL